MRLPVPLTIAGGHLSITGHDCVGLAAQYGTPVCVTSGASGSLTATMQHPPWPLQE